MELRKKSILIALAIGDGCILQQKKTVKEKTYEYSTLEIDHSSKQKEYLEWKADLCRRITGRKCKIKERIIPERIINPKYPSTPAISSCRFTCTHRYYRIIRKWMYPAGKKTYNLKYLKYLDALGLAIWYMDDGNTYVRKDESAFNCEIATFASLEEVELLINYFQDYWNIKFNKHHVGKNQYNIRTGSYEGAKFIKLISPFVPQCMDYKLKIPKRFIQECVES